MIAEIQEKGNAASVKENKLLTILELAFGDVFTRL